MTLLHRVALCPSAELSSSGGCGSRHLYRDPSLEGTIQYLTVYIKCVLVIARSTICSSIRLHGGQGLLCLAPV